MKVAYLFPGQGSQFVGMGQALYTQVAAARALFDAADDILGFPLSRLCFEGPEEMLTSTINQQPALFVTSIATLRAMEAAGWEAPAFVAGHSLGEFSALTAVGSLPFEAGLKLVRRRGELMEAAGERDPGGMAAVLGLDMENVAAACAEAQAAVGKAVQVANDNCPGQVVISGDKEAVTRAAELLAERGARKVVHLPITIAAHSNLMASAAAEFAKAVDATPFARPSVPVIGNTSATPLTEPEAIKAELKAQLTGPVRWTESMSYLVAQGVDSVVEVGPGDTLQGLMKRIDRSVSRMQFNFEEA